MLAADAGPVFHLADANGTVIAFNAQSGAVNWTSQPSGTLSIATPGGCSGRVVVITDEHGITARAFDVFVLVS